MPLATRQACPLTPIVGACCSACAHGKPCEGEEEIRAIVAGLPGFIEEGRAWTQVEGTAEDISKLGADLAVKAPELLPEYDAFVRDWGVWFAAHKDRSWIEDVTFAPHIIAGDVLAQYLALVARYTAIRNKLVAMGVTPTAPETDKTIADRALGSIGQGAVDALGGIAKVGVYLAVGLGAAALIWFGAPILLKKVL
jgi:hypothetical protein